MMKKKIKVQSLIFDNKHFNRSKIKIWIEINGFSLDKRLRKPIMKFEKTFRVRQRNPDWFIKKTFKVQSLGIGVKGVYGRLKNKNSK